MNIRQHMLNKDLKIESLLQKITSQEKRESIEKIHAAHKRLFPKIKSNFQDSDNTLKPNFRDLKKSFKLQVEKLNKRYPTQSTPTSSENRLLRKIKLESKKYTLQSQWIGSHCYDLFVPNVKIKRGFCGLLIEVDGDVHNYEGKMIKDEFKRELAAYLRIGFTSVNNWETNHVVFRNFIQNLHSLPSPDSRERTRMWTKIYAYTAAIQLNDEEFLQLYKQKPSNQGVK